MIDIDDDQFLTREEMAARDQLKATAAPIIAAGFRGVDAQVQAFRLMVEDWDAIAAEDLWIRRRGAIAWYRVYPDATAFPPDRGEGPLDGIESVDTYWDDMRIQLDGRSA